MRDACLLGVEKDTEKIFTGQRSWHFDVRYRAGEPLLMIADIQKAENLLDWKPLVSLRDGLRKTFDWWLENEKFWKE